jgi:hypothetical protein
MAWKISTALRNAMLEMGSFKKVMSNCIIKVYSGGQPATAELAPTGTLLCTYSDASGTPTREVRAQGTVTYTGTSGSADALTVNGLEIMGSATANTGVLATTVQAIADKINHNPKNLLFVASANAGVLTLTAKPGLGALANGWAVVSTTTTMGRTDVNIGTTTAGVTAVNGLNWGDAVGAVLPKHPTQSWSGVPVASGTAGWFRIEAAVNDASGVDASESILRADGLCATSGAELNMNTTFTIGVTKALSDFAVTFQTN